MTSAISLHTHNNIENNLVDNATRPEFKGGTTLFAVMALYALQNLLLKVMKLYSKAVAEQKNISLGMAAKSGDNIKDAGAMQATSMILAGVGSIVGAALAVGFTLYGSKALKQTQADMKSVNNKLSIVDKNLNKLENPPKKGLIIGKGDEPNLNRFDSIRLPTRYNARNQRVRFDLLKRRLAKKNMVSDKDIMSDVKNLDKTKFTKEWGDVDTQRLDLGRSDIPELKQLNESLRSEKKTLNKRMDTLSGEHNAELNKATQRGQLSNSFAQGAGQTSSGIPHVAKGEYDSAAQFTKAVGEQVEGASRMSEEARNQTLQSANHINQILDQLKAAEKAN